jgi:RHS repeat-associated protein
LCISFTGKERDAESGLDYFGARYYASTLGRFMSPDDFTKGTHVADPQSWNLYAYARNNPLRYIDRDGHTATVSTSCSTDANNHQTCDVSVSATIAIYAVPGSGLTNDQMNSAASTIQDSIDKAWSGSFENNGITYNVSTQVTVSVSDSQTAAEQSGAQNAVGISNGQVSATANALSGQGKIPGQDAGTWNFNTLGEGTAAHEFTHFLNDDDHEGPVLSNTHPEQRHTSVATPADYRWGLQEAIRNVDSWMGVSAQAPYIASPSLYDEVTIGASLSKWWK